MIFRVLGCSGSELDRCHPCSFIIDSTILVDVGCSASRLTLKEQANITDIFLSHAHLDHTKDIPFLAENVFSSKTAPIILRSTDDTLAKIKNHMLNNELWPDFTILPDEKKSILKYQTFETGKVFSVGSVEVMAIPVHHPGGCVAMFFRSKEGTILYTGDTGPTEEVWKEVNQREDMKAILLETSFPNELEKLAQVSGHHTPNSFSKEIKKIHSTSIPIFAYHLKAPYQSKIADELKALQDDRVHFFLKRKLKRTREFFSHNRAHASTHVFKHKSANHNV